MKKSAIVIGALLIALVAMFLLQRQTQTALRQQNDSLRAQLEQLQNDNASLSNSLTQKQNAQPTPNDSRELARLRNEVGMLRERANQPLKTDASSAQPAQPTTTRQIDTEPVTEDELFQLTQWRAANSLKQIELANKIYAVDHNDQFATNFAQIMDSLGGVTNFGRGVTLDSFEFVNPGLANDSIPYAISFREINPRRTPGGQWVRVYGMADGSVQTKYSDDGNFDDYEKEHSPQSPPPQ